MGTRSFPGVRRPGRDANHPSPSSTEVKERVEVYLYSPSGRSWPVPGRKIIFLLFFACVWHIFLLKKMKRKDIRGCKTLCVMTSLSCGMLEAIWQRIIAVKDWLAGGLSRAPSGVQDVKCCSCRVLVLIGTIHATFPSFPRERFSISGKLQHRDQEVITQPGK